ncbi:TOMM precursor leader peptide-binding protein [Nonomuraea soli]|uniref:Bacteriocin biosynthesis cyclodehydratase domain-containing protein n=1 Tax=Nonomuraea soli TaxID=1032476 RepID=A0A7W0HMN7_9ACTN|nr:TOMM precursor leader peptide-binding protein [Nonomuraea soli]MBA2888938.1 bacteriocin biosynthesis cyclodehydratase domain-containing protein [Nonomuraea soli]
MAAAVRLTGPRVVAVGPFGHALAALLDDSVTGPVVHELAHPGPSVPPVTVLAAWRPEPELCDELDRQAFESALPWLPVVVDHPHLVAGPLVVPPRGPCHRCYLIRRRRHDGDARLRDLTAARRRADSGAGVAGHLPHHVRIAQALVQRLLTATEPGEIHLVDMATLRLTTHTLLPAPECPRCGEERSP